MCILLSLQLFRENANPTLEATEVTASKLSNACKRCKGSNTNKLKRIRRYCCLRCSGLLCFCYAAYVYLETEGKGLSRKQISKQKWTFLCRREAHISELLWCSQSMMLFNNPLICYFISLCACTMEFLMSGNDHQFKTTGYIHYDKSFYFYRFLF